MGQLSDADKIKVRYHLNYPAVDTTLVTNGGVSYAGEAVFSLEYAMDHVATASIPTIQRVVGVLDTIETQMADALTRLQASKADVVTLNPHEHSELQNQYNYWQNRLSMQLSVPVNPHTHQNSGLNGLNARLRR